ncbi:hypothetical protein Rcae01_00554 [Novipirellula caenicola]|uniref:Uncharacterized protein n=1 Tax=Novipirellula caenicola TaxID=1536901 RepID=A0ABP9VLS8_9BACT
MYDQREKAQRDDEWAISGAREEGWNSKGGMNSKGSNLFFNQQGHSIFCDCVATLNESLVKIWNRWNQLLA